jgi:Cu/Zn superoxide dismutase
MTRVVTEKAEQESPAFFAISRHAFSKQIDGVHIHATGERQRKITQKGGGVSSALGVAFLLR